MPKRFAPARALMPWLAVASLGCGQGPTPAPAPSSAPTAPAPSAAPAGPVAVDALHAWALDAGTLALSAPAGRRLTVVAAAPTDAAGPHDIQLSVEGEPARARRVATAAPSWPFPLAAPGPAPGGTRRVLAAQERTVGATESFWINDGSFQPSGDVQRTAVLERITPHAYFYLGQQAQGVSAADVEDLAAAFESRIYPAVTGLAGAPAAPGVDGEERLFVVITSAFHGGDLLGYFWARDAQPVGPAHSNHKEVLFMSDKLPQASPLLSRGALAHELEHLINFSRKGPRLDYAANEATWLDEGLAMLAMDIAGYGFEAGEKLVLTDVKAYELQPEAYSLTDWAGNPNGYAFGEVYLFCRYLVDRYGTGIVRELIDSDRRGVDNVGAALASRGTTFEDFFRSWLLANVLTGDPLAAGTPYHYERFQPQGSYGGIQLPGFHVQPLAGQVTAALKPWGAAYWEATSQVPVARDVRITAPARRLGATIVR